MSQVDFLYAGIQKNVGPAGAVVGIIKQSFLAAAREDLPVMLKYDTFFTNDSTYNTPPVFCIYFVNKVLRWLDENGGLTVMEQKNKEKAAVVYAAIDESNGFYRGHAVKDSRSLMNVTFGLATAELEKEFIDGAEAEGLIGLKGHRSLGGCRASIYNAVTLEGCEKLAGFMERFRRSH
ncbi:putative phosphoserine transaminase [Anaeroglobus geminatus F0357]|uniref:Phosphoserine aminotransferase n=2 Tax=Anaeroglobus TaxID=156454 RepID=G9YF41_9FIRM|nr:putative phosphoserine transaminase [Anaeroglobus geminatus F0357]